MHNQQHNNLYYNTTLITNSQLQKLLEKSSSNKIASELKIYREEKTIMRIHKIASKQQISEKQTKLHQIITSSIDIKSRINLQLIERWASKRITSSGSSSGYQQLLEGL